MMRAERSAHAWRAFAFLVFAASASTAAEPADREAEKTADGIREMLETAWNTPEDRFKKIGNGILQRNRNKAADIFQLYYAYGIVLARHGEWAAAETNFKKAAHRLSPNVHVWLAFSHVHLRMGKIVAALEDLREGWQVDPNDPRPIATLAGLMTFLASKPPAKFRIDDARKVEEEIFPKLDKEQQEQYRQAQAAMKEYIDSLPALRKELMEPVETMRADAVKAEKEAKELSGDLRIKEAELQRRVARIEQIQATAIAEAASFDRLIQQALARGDSARAQGYQTEKIATLDAAEARADVERARAQEVATEVEQMQQELRGAVEQAEALTAEVANAASAIESQLNQPPALWDAGEERERLLASGTVGAADKKGADAPNAKPRLAPTEEDRSRSLLFIADSLRASGMPQLARRYYERIAKEYPKTQAGKDAAWELEQLDKAPPKEQKLAKKRKKK